MNDAITIWSELLSADNPLHITKALKDFIKTDTSGFPPTIGQIRNLAREYRYQDFIAFKDVDELLPAPPKTEEEIKKREEQYAIAKKILERSKED